MINHFRSVAKEPLLLMKVNLARLPRLLLALFVSGLFAVILCEQFDLSRAIAVPLALFMVVQLQSRGLL